MTISTGSNADIVDDIRKDHTNDHGYDEAAEIMESTVQLKHDRTTTTAPAILGTAM